MSARRSATVAGFAVAIMAMTGCSGESHGVHFSRSSVDVLVAPGDSFPGNFVFLAHSSDPIWQGIENMTLSGGGRDIIFGASAITVERGDTVRGMRLGNLMVDIPMGNESIEFTTVDISLGGGRSDYRTDVGSWLLEPESESIVLGPTEGLPVASSRCGDFEFMLSQESGDQITPIGVQTGADGTQIENVSLPHVLYPGQKSEASFTIVCDEDFDVHYVTPRLVYTDGDGEREAALISMNIGLLGIDDHAIDRILDHPAAN
ncbi:hypothetical protein [Microbacterium amylolyticum]|uniref:Lipoprotein n=1 Tax=Microbacterium amylolyticum TaxID=936337 RepID=A0ABS4ZI12_9MICO|nr:hypothetical protein [Microbacterium amylolyticum]MBP2436847.1 hypothetical protein [Microbacterium amylolyticum]